MSKGPPIVLTGIGASSGVAIGRVYLLDRRKVRTPKHHVERDQVAAELARLDTAMALSDEQLQEVKARLDERDGDHGEHGMILEAHRLMLQDVAFRDEARRLVQADRLNAEWAVRRTAKRIREQFEKIDDEYFRERKQDVDFVADRVIRNLMGQHVDLVDGDVPADAVVVAHDLSPADAALLLQPGKVLGLVLDLGGKTSHTAIVSRARGIPAVVGATKATELATSGEAVAIDGDRGVVVLRPNAEQLVGFGLARERQARQETRLRAERELPPRTLDGVEVGLHANIEFEEELPYLQHVGAGGIGLYRTEFLYLGRDDLPDEEEHYEAYRRVLEAMAGMPVTIRTLDIGGDKIPSEKGRRDEANPALGLRAIRYCSRHPELFHTQLRALLRASVHGQLRILFPMISGLTELREARAALEAARADLGRQGYPVADRIPVGVMIELPSAAQMADRLAREVDFFSIGTNDLIQYSLAIDRQNRDVDYLYRPLHLAILRMVRFTVEAAHAQGIRVSMCGEMAGDPYYAEILLGMQVDELSMASSSIPLLRRVIRAASARDGRDLLEQAMALTTAEEIERFVRAEMDRRHGAILSGKDDEPDAREA